MEKELKSLKIKILDKKEITKEVAPSIELEQKFYNTLGFAIKRIITSLKTNKPFTLKILYLIYKIILNKRKRIRLENRLFNNTRTIDTFIQYNNYMIFKLKPKDQKEA